MPRRSATASLASALFVSLSRKAWPHALVVSALSIRVGRELQLAAGELELLEFAAAVHDVGKLSVAPSIITKPGPLNDDEWTQMRRHPDAGADLLAPCAAPAEVLDVVRSHHEHWDG